MSRRFLFFAASGLLFAAVVLGLPYALEGVVEAKLAQRLEARRVEATWKSLALRLPASVELEGVEFSLADDRLRGRVDTVAVALPWDVAFQAEPQIDEISLEGGQLSVDLRASRAHSTDQVAANPGQDKPADASRVLEALEKLRRIGAVSGKDIELEVLRDSRPLAQLEVEAFEVSDSTKGHRTVAARGEIDVSDQRLSRLSLSTIPWKVSGRMGGTDEQATLELELTTGADDEERPLVRIAAPGLGRLSVHRAKVRAFSKPALGAELWLHDVQARLGSAKAAAVELTVPEMGVSKLQQSNLRLVVTRPLLALSPARLAKMRSRLAKLLGNGLSKDVPAKKAGSPAPKASGAGVASRLRFWLQRLDATVSQGRFDLRLDDDTRQVITLADALDATLDQGRLQASGRSAGGKLAVDARFVSGSLLPRMLAVEAVDVRLDDLPGVKEGRTLPNRGIRGRIGGIIDAQVLLTTDGEPLLRPTPNAHVNVSTMLAWRDGHVDVSGLADGPLTGVEAGVDFDLRWTPALGQVLVQNAEATYGPVAVNFHAELVDFPLDPVFDLEARVQKIACQDAVRAFPKAMLGAYSAVEIDGEVAPTLRFYLPWHRPQKLRLELDGFVDECHVTSLRADKNAWPDVTFAQGDSPRRLQRARRGQNVGALERAQALDVKDAVPSVANTVNTDEPTAPVWPVPEKLAAQTYKLPEPPEDYRPNRRDDVIWLNRPFVKQVTEGVSEDAEVFVGPGTEAYVPIEELPPFVAGASYLSEEMEFYENHGVDLGLIQKALRIDFEGERFVYGGSTVTQQLVKNLFLSRDKTLARKLKEALIAWRIEDAVPKWRVLELYLNCIEYAKDIYGIGPAAKYYFGKDARELTPKEAVFIAILKPAPWYGDRFRKKGHTPTKHWWFNRMGEIMGRLVDKGYLTAEQAEAEKPYVLYWDEDGRYLPNASPSAPEDLPGLGEP